MNELDELKTLAAKVKEKKGRMDAAQRKLGAELIASILNGPFQDISEPLRLAEDFQSDAVAEGIGKAWPNVPGERRLQIMRWLPAPHGERSQRRLALVAARVSESDGITAIELLDKLLPDNRPGKELRQLLLGNLLCKGQTLNLEVLANAAGHRSTATVLAKLAKLAFDATSGVEPMTRYRVAIALITVLRAKQIERSIDGGDLLHQVVTEVERWPEGLRKQFGGWLRTNASELEQDFFPLTRAATTSASSPAADVVVHIEKEDDEGAELALARYLQDRTKILEGELSALSQIRQALTAAQERQRTETVEAKAREQKLSLQVRDLESTKFTLQQSLAESEKRISDLQASIQQMQLARETERGKLTQQITANANGRIGEFQQQVAMTLAKHLLDLPAKNSDVTPELGRVLLLQFHQLIEVLGQLGITLPLRNAR
jgi:hypothetical protein